MIQKSHVGLALILLAGGSVASASIITTYVGSVEDTSSALGPCSTTQTSMCADFDYNDMIFSLGGGGVSAVESGGVWSPLSGVILNSTTYEMSGTPFWNNTSAKGANQNIGNALTSAPLDVTYPDLTYLATASGGSVNTTFTSTGTVTITLLAVNTADTGTYADELGWYLLSSPTTVNPLFTSGVSTAGNTATFDPTGPWALVLLNNGFGWEFKSDGTDGGGVGNSGTGNHFAFFAPVQSVPEPATVSLGAIGAVLLGLRGLRRRKA